MEATKRLTFVIDLDGTLWDSEFVQDDETKGHYVVTRYKINIIKIVNNLFNQGHFIILQTARHWDKFQETIDQLKEGGVFYSTLMMGNVPANYYINDKNITLQGFIYLYETKFKKGE